MASLLGKVRGVFVGSGSDGLNVPAVRDAILALVVRKPGVVQVPRVLYLGTATYDEAGPRERQTVRFAEAGCEISHIDLAVKSPPADEMKAKVDAADVIIVSGGNTLYALDRCNAVGLTPMLREAMERGCVLAGGSAGAICWFDAGHSDSMDPDSYLKRECRVSSQEPKAAGAGAGAGAGAAAAPADESGADFKEGDEAKPWKYIRVPCLGFLPGLVCPHHDKVQSNGILRAVDFDEMLKRHSAEQGICIDHWAALVLHGDETFRVLSLEGQPGSVLVAKEDDGGGGGGGGGGAEATFSAERAGKPGVWLKRVEGDGADKVVVSRLCPWEGRVEDILVATPAGGVVGDPAVEECRKENPPPAGL